MHASRVESNIHTRLLRLTLLAVLLTLCVAAAARASDATGVRELRPGKPVERSISSGELHRYRVALRKGQALFVEIDEQGFDVKVELLGAAGGKVVASMNLGAGFERETLTFEAGADNDYLLQVSDAEGRSLSGSYRLSAKVTASATERDRYRIEAERLLAEAAALHKEGTATAFREAIGRRERALALWQRVGDRYWESYTLNRLGAAHNALQENNKAVEYLDRALLIVSALGDKKIEADALNGYGATLNGFGEYRQAIERHEQALSLFREAKSGLGEASALMRLGISYVGLKDYAKADERYQQGLAVARSERNKNWEASFLYLLGAVLEAQNEKPKAAEHYERALALWRETKHDGGVALALLGLGKVYAAQGDADKAAPLLNEALALFKSEKNRGQEAATYQALSGVYFRQGKADEGIDSVKRALAYYQEFRVRVMEVVTTGLLASLYTNRGNYAEAVKYAEMSLATEESVAERISDELRKSFESGMKGSKAMSLQTLGTSYYNTGDEEKALGYYGQALAANEKLGGDSRKLNASILNMMAQIYRGQYKWDKALETYNRSLTLARELDDKVAALLALNSIGLIYGGTGDARRALQQYTETLEVLRSLPNRGDPERRFEADILSNIAGSHLALGDPQKALDFHRQSLAVYQTIKDPLYIDGQAGAYRNLGNVYAFLGRNAEALEMLNKALELYRHAPPQVKALARNRTTEVGILNSIGVLYRKTGEMRRALEIHEQTLKTALEVKSLGLEAATLNNIGQINIAFGEPQKALQNFSRALEITRRIGDKPGEPTLLSNISMVYSYWNDRQQAIKYTTEAVAIAEAIGDRSHTATFLNNLGSDYMALAENDKALDHLNRALAIAREIGNRGTECTALGNLAFLASNMGERGKALDYYEQALNIARGMGERESEATVLGNMAFDYLELGENQKALEARRQALNISRETGDKSGEINHLFGLGNAYRKIGEKEKSPEHFRQASNHYEQSAALSRTTENEMGEAAALLGLGQVYIETGETARALPLLSQALSYSRKHQSRTLEDATLYALGRLHEKEGRLNKAVEEYRGAVTVARAISDRDVEARSLKGLMTASRAQGDALSAIFYGKQSVNTYQQLRGSIRNLKSETQDVFRDKVTEVYRELSNLLIEQGRLPEAEQVLGMLKEAEFKQLQVMRGGTAPATIPYSATEADALAKVESLVALERERADLLKTPADDLSAAQTQRLAQLDREIHAANAAFDESLKALSVAQSSAARPGEVKKELETAIQRTLTTLGRKTSSRVVALYTVLGTERGGTSGTAETKFGWVIMVTEGGRKAYPINVANLNDLVFRFRDALTTDRYDPRPLAKKIYDAIFRQTSPKQKRTLEADLRDSLGARGVGTIMWSLDGVLRYIPMAALHDGESYLAEKYRNVVFSGFSARSLTDEDEHDWQVLGLGLSEARENFAPLPGVKAELENIVRQPDSPRGIFRGTIKLDQDFKKSVFINAVRGGSYPVVHIASHYSYNPTQQEASFLLIGDGHLTFGEMGEDANLFGAVDLLTLSACDTATSANGEESEGFAFKAQELGAKSVIASLWKVSDAGTPELMTRFYRLRADDPSIPKGEAFRRAQLSLLYGGGGPAATISTFGVRGAKMAGQAGGSDLPLFIKDAGRPYAHPHYWASFVLIGNWR